VDGTIEDTLLDLANYAIMEVLERMLESRELTEGDDSEISC